MKIKLLILGLGLGASILAGCNDDFSSIGTSIQPGDDTIAEIGRASCRERV